MTPLTKERTAWMRAVAGLWCPVCWGIPQPYPWNWGHRLCKTHRVWCLAWTDHE